MATKRWKGGYTPGLPGIWYYIPANVQIGNIFSLTRNGKTISYQTPVGTVADVVSGLFALLTATGLAPEFNEFVYGNNTTFLGITEKGTGSAFGTAPPSPTGTAAIGAGPTNQTPTVTVNQTLAVPVNAAFGTSSTGGSLSNGTYFYRVTAFNAAGETTASTETSIAIAGGTATQEVIVNWNRVPGALGYRIYGRATGAELYIAGVLGEGTLTYTDTGAIAPSGALPGSNTTAQTSSGPNNWNTPQNWDAGAVPVNTDDVVVQKGSYDILYGINQSGVTLNSLTVDQDFTPGTFGQATIGLPEQNTAGYEEDRPTYLQVGITTASKILLGAGTGGGAGRWKIDGNASNCVVQVDNSGNPIDTGIESILLRNFAAGSTLNVTKGYVGVAIFAGETCNFSTGITISYLNNVGGDAYVRLGAGVTLGPIKKDGGRLYISSTGTITTYTDTAGETWHMAGVVQTLTVGGTYHENAPGTPITTACSVQAKGFLDFGQDSAAKTVTPQIQVFAGGKVRDPLGIVTRTGGWTIPDGTLKDVDVNWGFGRV
jgi:hypothetical protein